MGKILYIEKVAPNLSEISLIKELTKQKIIQSVTHGAVTIIGRHGTNKTTLRKIVNGEYK